MAEDKIIIEYEVRNAQLGAALDKVEKDLKDVEKAAGKSIAKVGTEAKKAGVEIEKTAQKTSVLKDKLNDLALNLPYAAQIKQVAELGNAVINLGGAAQKSSTGFQILKVAIASTGIGLLIAAIVSLITYFKRTDEGAERLKGILGGLNAALDLITGATIQFGEAVFTAFTSVDNLKKGIGDLGDFLINNLMNRLKAPITAFEALQLAIGGNFQKATLRFLDATAQLASGITDVTSKTIAFTEEAAAAAAAAFEWEQRMDALDDKMREDSVVIAENERAVSKLVIASKNKQLADEESLAKLDEASKLEKANIALVISNEEAKLKLIQERNAREEFSINQDIKNGETRRSINDELAQEEFDQIVKIVKLRESSDNLLEKVNNRRDAKLEEIFQNNIKRVQEEAIFAENSVKERYLKEGLSAEVAAEEILIIKQNSLKKERDLLIAAGRSTIEIDKAILDIQLQIRAQADKEKAEQDKIAADAALKAKLEADKKQKEADEKKKKEDEEREKEHREKINFIINSSVDIAKDLINGLYDNSSQRRQQDLEEELSKSEKNTDNAITSLQKQLDTGLINQEQFDQRKNALQQKQAKTEAALKRKQFEADKRAKLTQVAIDTAVAVIKTIANLGYPAGLAASLLVVAQGAVQAALIQSQPTPKFKDGVIGLKGKGTGTSDSIPAMLSKGESVMTARETHVHRPILEAIRDNSIDDYIKNSYVLPAIKEIDVKNNRSAIERSQSRDRKIDAILNNMNFDTTNIERAVKNNKSVLLKNSSQLAKEIGREMSINSNWYK